jgi:arylsulfatase A-like enzyme
MLVLTDHYVGQMFDALNEDALDDDTVVIFTADNRAAHPDNGAGKGAPHVEVCKVAARPTAYVIAILYFSLVFVVSPAAWTRPFSQPA